MTQSVRATCHCGAVQIEATLRASLETARRCDCSFCKRRQAANVSADFSSVRVLRGRDDLSCYTFGTHTAQHYFCKHCGIYTHHRRFSDPSEAGINLYCIEDQSPSDFEPLGWNDGTDL